MFHPKSPSHPLRVSHSNRILGGNNYNHFVMVFLLVSFSKMVRTILMITMATATTTMATLMIVRTWMYDWEKIMLIENPSYSFCNLDFDDCCSPILQKEVQMLLHVSTNKCNPNYYLNYYFYVSLSSIHWKRKVNSNDVDDNFEYYDCL